MTNHKTYVIINIERNERGKKMKHNKWFVGCLGFLVISAIPGGLGIMLGVLTCVICAGGCFAKWLVEEDKHQRAEYEKYLENLKKRSWQQDSFML